METALRRKHIAQASYLSLTFFYCHVLFRRMHRVKPPLHNRTYVTCAASPREWGVRFIQMSGSFVATAHFVEVAFPMGSPWVPHGFPMDSPWAPRYGNGVCVNWLFYFLRQNWTNDCSWFFQNCESKAAWRHEPILAKRLYTWNCSSRMYCGRPAYLCLCKIMWRARGNQRSETKLAT